MVTGCDHCYRLWLCLNVVFIVTALDYGNDKGNRLWLWLQVVFMVTACNYGYD